MLDEYNAAKAMIEEKLLTFFVDETLPQSRLLEAMRYSLLVGGKRIRPVLTLKFCEAVGGRVEDAIDFASAVEMIHTYSLIHDDLPCMDDDDMRRGRPSNHMVFGEAGAVLAGDALLTAAFSTALASPGLSYEARCRGAAALALAAGELGMVGGQTLDMEERPLTEGELYAIHERKTGALISAASILGVIAGGGGEAQLKSAEEFSRCIGLAFQIRDDVLDKIGSASILGKPVNSDEENGKTTFFTLFGEEKCDIMIKDLTESAIFALEGNFADSGFLKWLANWLSGREF